MHHQIFQHLVFVGRQVDTLLVNEESLGGDIQTQTAELELRFCKARSASQQGIQPSNDFFQLEGLDDVVICTGIQTRHFILPVTARSEDQDWVFLSRGPNLLN